MADFNSNLTFFPPLGPATSQKQVDPQGWDKCVLAGSTIPGFCKIPNAEILLKLDKKPKHGSDGANPTILGIDPQPLVLEIMTFTDADREALVPVIGPYLPAPGVKSKPVAIDHPSLRAIRVYAVIIQGASALTPIEGTTKAKMTLRLQHWLPSKQKSAVTTPKGAPVRKVKNVRKKPSDTNPTPTQQKGFGQPPARLGNGQ